MTEPSKGFDSTNIENTDVSRYQDNKPQPKKEDATVHEVAKEHLSVPAEETKQEHLIKPQEKKPSSETVETVKKRVLPESSEPPTTSFSQVQNTPKELQHIVETSLIPTIPLPQMSKKVFSIDERMKDLGVTGLSIGVINNGKVEWVKGYGELSERDLLSQIGSISKTFTSLTLLSLIEQCRTTALQKQPSGFVDGKRIDLDTDVREILGEKLWSTIDPNKLSEDKDHKVTIRRLLTHTASIVPGGGCHIHLPALKQQIARLQSEIERLEHSIQPSYQERESLDSSLILKREKLTSLQKLYEENAVNPPPTLDDYLQGKSTVGPITVTSEPSDNFEYSNPGYAILQKVIETLTGEPFSQVVQKRVLTPLGMNKTTVKPPLEHTAPGNSAEQPIDGLWLKIPEEAAGGIWSNAHDMTKFISGLHTTLTGNNTSIISSEFAQEMITSPTKEESYYALGIIVDKKPNAIYFSHSGGTPGFRTRFVINDQGSGIIILTNSEEGQDFMPEIERSIAETYNWPDRSTLPFSSAYVKPEELSTVDPKNWVEGPKGIGGHYIYHVKDKKHTVDIIFKQGKVWADVDGGKTKQGGETYEIIPLGQKIAYYRIPPNKPSQLCRFFEEKGKTHLDFGSIQYTRSD